MRKDGDDRIREFTARGWWGTNTLDDAFREAAKHQPQRLALVDQPSREQFTEGAPNRLTYDRLARTADKYVEQLASVGIGPGRTVVVQLPNITELVVLYLAFARLGAIISPVPMQYGRHELTQIAHALQPWAYIGVTRFKDSRPADRLSGVPIDRRYWIGRDVASGEISLTTMVDDSQGTTTSPVAGRGANDIATICWTSGTTGQPKGVLRTDNQWFAISTATFDAADLHDGDVLLNPFPFVNMASIGGFLYNWLLCRGTLVLHHPFDPQGFLQQIATEKPALTIAPPAVLNMLLKNPDLCSRFDLSSLRAIASGSAPLSPWMVNGFRDAMGIEIINLFGSNEGICLAGSARDIPDTTQRATLFPRFGVEGLDFTSRVARMIRTRLRDRKTGAIVSNSGESGEMEIDGPTLFDGYIDPLHNLDAFTEDGYFRTGDLFEIVGKEPARFYRFIGRCKDIILRGGFNISPDELDTLLAGHPQLADVATVGYPDEVLGERVAVFAVVRDGGTVDLASIVDFLAHQDVATFKFPERLVLTQSLPRNPLGKVIRDDLRALLSRDFEDTGR